ncbi:MAG: hypothetical protein QOG75_5959 [Mycobacterium sp.]|jgi:hypothetical protein|nr:hypothetical protein [Mycobacterium sp.]
MRLQLVDPDDPLGDPHDELCTRYVRVCSIDDVAAVATADRQTGAPTGDRGAVELLVDFARARHDGPGGKI